MKAVRALSIALLLICGGSAIVGGGSMLLDTSGSTLGLSVALLRSTPFVDYFIPGLVLFVIIGISGIVTGILTILRSRYSAQLTILQGAIVASWIAIQAFLLQIMDPIQMTVGAIGFTLFCLGLFLAGEETVTHDRRSLYRRSHN